MTCRYFLNMEKLQQLFIDIVLIQLKTFMTNSKNLMNFKDSHTINI